jgi:hypothetical protein
MDSFSAEISPQDLLDRVVDALRGLLGQIEAKFEIVMTAFDRGFQLARETATASHVLGTDIDDAAEDLTGALFSEGLLADAPTDVKIKLIQEMIDGATEDAQEQRILQILEETKLKDPQEFYQIVAAVGWDELDSNLHGDEWDKFMRLMNS